MGQERGPRALFDVGANVNKMDDNGVTALMQARHEGHTEIVAMLRNAGAR